MSRDTYFHACMSPSSYYSIVSYISIWTDELIEISGSLWVHLLKVQLLRDNRVQRQGITSINYKGDEDEFSFIKKFIKLS